MDSDENVPFKKSHSPLFPYIGQEGSAELLESTLRSEPGALIVVGGNPGSGKTTLMSHFVTSRYESELIQWISGAELKDPAVDLGDIAKRVSNRAERPRIIVLDGADEARTEIPASLIEEFKSKFPDVPLVVTSRQSMMLRDAKYVSLESFTSEQAKKFLETASGQTISQHMSDRLAKRVNFNPLALNILGALLKETSASDLLAQLGVELFNLGKANPVPETDIIQAVRPRIIEISDLLIENLKKQPQQVHDLHPHKFEELIGKLLQDQGWEVTLTKRTRDGGKDILAVLKTEMGRFLCLVEAKKYSPDHPIGVELVRSLYGVFCDYQANSALLVTTSRFTQDAHDFQKRHEYQLALRDYWDVVGWIKKFKGNA